jgi:hypothetical protein
MRESLRQARARTAFSRQEADAQERETYRKPAGEQVKDAQPLQVTAALTEEETKERRELTEFIVLNRGYREEEIPREKRFLNFYDTELLRQIKLSI